MGTPNLPFDRSPATPGLALTIASVPPLAVAARDVTVPHSPEQRAAEHSAASLLDMEWEQQGEVARIADAVLGPVGAAFRAWWVAEAHRLAWQSRRAMLVDLRWWTHWSAGPDGRSREWPVTPARLLAWVLTVEPTARGATRAQRPVSMATIQRRLWSMHHLHVAVQRARPDQSIVDPTRHPMTVATLREWARAPRDRRLGYPTTAPILTARTQRPPLTFAHEEAIRRDVEQRLLVLARTEGKRAALDTRRLCRDYALFLVARDVMARRGELSAFIWSDWPGDTKPMLIASSKTDQEGRGVYRPLTSMTCAALTVWQRFSRDGGAEPNWPIFSRLAASGAVTQTPLTGHAIDRIIREMATSAGLTPAFGTARAFGAHSTRIGMAIDLLRAGMSVAQVMAAGRWRDIRMLSRYVEQEGLDGSVVADARARRLRELVTVTTAAADASVEMDHE